VRGGRRRNRLAGDAWPSHTLAGAGKKIFVRVQSSNLAVDGEAFGLQGFEGIDEDWIIVVGTLPVQVKSDGPLYQL
jgi:hypothetical protein